jgi:hypothetical protein
MLLYVPHLEYKGGEGVGLEGGERGGEQKEEGGGEGEGRIRFGLQSPSCHSAVSAVPLE